MFSLRHLPSVTLTLLLATFPARVPAKEEGPVKEELSVEERAQAAGLRRFTTRDRRSFWAEIVSKRDTSVTFRMANGREETLPIRLLSEPDQNHVRKWTKFKDELLKTAEFGKLTVQELLQLRGYQAFEFDIEGNHIYVEGEINGKSMKLLIDTGAQSSIIHLAAAKRAGLNVGPMTEKIYGVAGEAPAAPTPVPVIKLGDAVIKNRTLLATDLFKEAGGNESYAAIFGADFLREFDAAISYREGRMFLWAPEEEGGDKASEAAGGEETRQEFRRWTSADGKTMFAALESKTEKDATFRMQNGKLAKVPLDRLSENDKVAIARWDQLRDKLALDPQFKKLSVRELLELRGYQDFKYRPSGNHILIDGKANDTPARFLIDTGAHGGVFHLPFAEKAKLEVGPLDQWIYGIGGKAPAALCKVQSLTLGEVIINDREMLATDLEKHQKAFGGSHDAIFGSDFLRELDAVISYKEQYMFLRPDFADERVKEKGEEG